MTSTQGAKDEKKNGFESWFTIGRLIGILAGVIAISVGGGWAAFGQSNSHDIDKLQALVEQLEENTRAVAEVAQVDQRQNRVVFVTFNQFEQMMIVNRVLIQALEERINRLEALLIQQQVNP